MYDADFVGQGARNICTKEALVSELLASDDACTSTPRHSKTSSKRTVLIFHCEYSSERAPKLYVSVFICLLRIGHKSAPIQLAQCWFPGLAISSAKIFVYFSNKIYGSDFVEQHTETVMVWNYENADCCLRKKILCQLWLFSAHFRPPYFDTGRRTPPLRVCCWAAGWQEMSICCTAGAQQQRRRSTSLNRKGEQCDVNSWRRKLNTKLVITHIQFSLCPIHTRRPPRGKTIV